MPKSRQTIIKKYIKYGNIKKVIQVTEASLKAHKLVADVIMKLAQYAIDKGQFDIFEYFIKYMDDNDKITVLCHTIRHIKSLHQFNIIINHIQNINTNNNSVLLFAVNLYSFFSDEDFSEGEYLYNRYGEDWSDDDSRSSIDPELYKNIVIELLKRGANPCNYNYPSILKPIITDENMDILKIFIAYSKFDITHMALEYSIKHNKYDFIEYLLGYVDINKKNKDGMTLLTVARQSENPNPDIIELLVESGARE